MGSFAALTSLSRFTGIVCGAVFTFSGSVLASSAIFSSAAAKASSVSLFYVSVGSIIIASWTMSGK